MIGYSEFRTDLPGGLTANRYTTRAYVVNQDGTGRRSVAEELMKPDTWTQFAGWSPDGNMLLFVSGEHYDCHPHTVRSDGTELRKLADRQGYSGVMTTIDVFNFHGGSSDVPVWSKDGKWVYYTAKVGESVEVMRVDLDGNIEQLTHTQSGVFNYHPTPSPDGEFWIIGSTRSGIRQLYVMRGDGGDIYPITDVRQGYGAMHPHWNPGS